MFGIRSSSSVGVLLCACFMGLLLGTSGVVNASQVSGTALPILTSASANTAVHDTIVVTGKSFTPGSMVFIALYDQWGTTLYVTRWVVASETQYGIHGGLDPATVYDEGGVIFASFVHLCGDEVMVRAYDQRSESWSNLLDVESGCQ